MKTKISFIFFSVLFTALFLTGCSSKEQQHTKVWNVASLQAETHPQTLAIKKWEKFFTN